jgi:hypothetical protein
MNLRNLFAPGGRKVAPSQPPAEPASQDFIPVPKNCSLFHITHWKAASQWFRAILRDAFGPSVVEPEYFERQVWAKSVAAGRVYPCVYLGKPEFDCLEIPGEARSFLLIRDLRDTLISAYYSLRNSHEIGIEEMSSTRHWLNRMNQEEGLLYLTETWIPGSARIQNTWLTAGTLFYRMEDCLGNEARVLRAIFSKAWGIDLDPSVVERLAERSSFAQLSGGRLRGDEDAQSHFRKGCVGDWKSHFTPALARRFDRLYSDLLVRGGYEAKPGWSDRIG